MTNLKVNPTTGELDLVRSDDELSAIYLKLDQTTPQTTVGTFTFPAVDTDKLTIFVSTITGNNLQCFAIQDDYTPAGADYNHSLGYFSLNLYGGRNIANAFGLNFVISNSMDEGTTLGTAYALNATYNATYQATTNAYGLAASIIGMGAGSVQNAYIIDASSASLYGHNLANLYSLHVSAPSAALTGTITTAYGLYIAEHTAASNNYEAWIAGAGEIWFRDSAIHIGSLDDGRLDLTADTAIDLNTTTIATTGIATFSRSLTTTPTTSIGLYESSASTAGSTAKVSPALRWYSRVWNTDGTPADNYSDWRLYDSPTSGNPPTSNLTLDWSLHTGTASYTNKFKFSSAGNFTAVGSGIFGTLTLGSGSITDSSGAISFGDENLSTTGTLGAGVITGTKFVVGTTQLYNKITRTVVIYDDGSWLNEEIPIMDFPDSACTITAIRSSVLGTGSPTITFNLEERPWGTDITTAGTVITSSAITADADGTETTSFSNAGMASKCHLVLTTAGSSVVGGTTQDALVITVEYTVNS